MNRIFLFLVFTIVLSCSKDVQVILPKKDCKAIDSSSPCFSNITGFLIKKGPIQRSDPYFNPNNANEFVFLENNSENSYALFIFDLVSKSKRLLFESTSPILDPKWAPNGLILFVNYDGGVLLYSIKADGTELFPIMEYSRFNQYVIFDVRSFLCCSDIGNGSSYLFGYDGKLMDSFPNRTFAYGDVSREGDNKGGLVTLDFKSIYVSNIVVLDKENLSPYFSFIPYSSGYRNSLLQSLSWHPNNEDVYYASASDIQKLNIKTYTWTLVKEGCRLDFYRKLRVSPDGKKILAESVHAYYDEKCTPYRNVDLVYMNIDGTEEVRLFE